jgi:hypothetical protein
MSKIQIKPSRIKKTPKKNQKISTPKDAQSTRNMKSKTT